jgi:tyrosinase
LAARGETLPDGIEVPGVDAAADGSFPNPLFIPVRRMQGDAVGNDPGWADPTDALQRPHFANQEDTGRVSFGGGVLEQPNNKGLFHDQAREIGQLDAQPHGSVHMRVHGAMALFQTAALDPIFWMHHCNVDRMWETFARDLGHGYPFAGGAQAGVGTAAHESWVAQKFRFLRPDNALREWSAPELLDVAALGYTYDTTAAPPLPLAAHIPDGAEDQPFGLEVSVPEPIAAAEAIEVSGVRVEVRIAGTADADLTVAAFPAEARWVLRFDGIRCQAPAPTSFGVYLGLADDEEANRTDLVHYAGLISLFGVFEASRDDGSAPGDGARRLLDVTTQVREQADTLRPLDAPVRLVAVDSDREVAEAHITVDRLTLEFA